MGSEREERPEQPLTLSLSCRLAQRFHWERFRGMPLSQEAGRCPEPESKPWSRERKVEGGGGGHPLELKGTLCGLYCYLLGFHKPLEAGHSPLQGARLGLRSRVAHPPSSSPPLFLLSRLFPAQGLCMSPSPPLSLCFLLPSPTGYPASHDSSFQGTDTDSSGAPLLQVTC